MALVDLARQMGKELQASEEYKAMVAAKEANDNDKELQDLIGKFNMKRIEINVANASDKKDEEKLATLDTELRAIYKDIMANESMAAFNAAKQALDAMMNEVTTILSLCMNGEDPDTCSASSCTGSCATCGGCH